MAQYKYVLWDLLSNLPKAEIPFSNVSFGGILNDAGPFGGSISARHAKANTDNLDPGRTAIFIDREGDIVWAGILWQIQVQSGSERSTLRVQGQELFSYFMELASRGRYIRHTRVYEDSDQLYIARDLIDYAQNTSLHGATADLNIDTGTELTTDNGGTQQLRTYIYNSWERKNIGTAIQQLAALQNGFEFYIDCFYSGGSVSKVFRMFYPTITDIPEILFDYPTNILTYTFPVDATTQAKKVDAIGQGEGKDMKIATAEDTTLTYLPMREAVFAYKDVVVDATLQAHADADLARVRLPTAVPTLICSAHAEEIRPGSLRCGANVNVRINDGWTQLDAPYRIVQYEVRVDDDGTEMMTVRLNTPEELGQ